MTPASSSVRAAARASNSEIETSSWRTVSVRTAMLKKPKEDIREDEESSRGRGFLYAQTGDGSNASGGEVMSFRTS